MKIKKKIKNSQWEILSEDIPIAQDGKRISLEDFKPTNPNSNEGVQQQIINNSNFNRSTKGSKENPVNLEEITVSAPRNRNPVTAQAAATRWKEENPELQGSSADLASAMFLAPVGEFSHTPSRVLNYGVGAYKNQDLRFNPYKSELSETLGLETNPDDAFHSVRNFFVDNAADFAAPSIIKSFGKGLNKSINYVDDINSINKELKFIRENGLSKGLSEKQIKSLQMEKVGITDNQRKAFTPVLSDALSKYVKPISYEEGVISKLKDIPKNIKQGGWKNDPYFKDYAHTGKREDAWNLYLGKPQKNNTFRYSETVPKSMYYPELKNNLDVYNLNYEDDLADFVKYMNKSKTSKYSDLVSGNTIYPSDAGVMGGYNLTRVDGNFPNIGKGIVEYNDIWDLHPKTTMRSLFPKPIAHNTWLNDNVFYKKNPNGSLTPREIELKMENFIGKPFMSHGRVPVNFTEPNNSFLNTISDKDKKLYDFLKFAKGYKYQTGGKIENTKPVNELEGDLYSKILMNRNKNKDFVKRAYAVGQYPESNMFQQYDFNEFGQKNSHLMSWGEDENGQAYMYPEIFNVKNEEIKVPNQYADYISRKGYKNATGIATKQNGGSINKYQTGDKIKSNWEIIY